MKHMRHDGLSPELIMRLQATAGNRAVQRLIARRRPTTSVASVKVEPAVLEPVQEDANFTSPGQWLRRLLGHLPVSLARADLFEQRDRSQRRSLD